MPRASLKDRLGKLKESPPPSTSNCCIYRVPERLRQINENSYTPHVVSIGPLHHGKDHLKFMEKHKERYMQDFLERTGIEFEDLVEFIPKEKEEKLRSCYSEEIEFDHYEFVEMVLVDATFIIELLLRYSFEELIKEDDCIFKKPYLIQDIWYDMWLLENQLPFFILEDIFDQFKVCDSIPSFTKDLSNRVILSDGVPDQIPTSEDLLKQKKVSESAPVDKPPIIKLTYKFFKSLEAVNGKLKKFTPGTKVEHFTDFLRICHLPSKKPPTPSQLPPQQKEKKVLTAPSVIQLHQAGVKFKMSPSKESFDINFTNGTLEIPQLKLQLESESLFRNLIAFEQRHDADNYINDYVFIIHHFVNTPKDVELLVQNGIIENWLPDKEGVSTLINNLSRGTTLDPQKFYFSSLCEQLKAYCERRYNMWRANLLQNYLNTPWASISVVGAIFLILLTCLQAVFSIIPVVSQQKNRS